MKILKAVTHLGVDSMLKAALGRHLTLWRPSLVTDAGERRYSDLGWWMPPLDCEIAENLDEGESWDIIIVDDFRTNEITKGMNARHRVWYVHGSYHSDNAYARGMRHYFNHNFGGFHLMFTDTSRRALVRSWFEHQPPSELILPIHPRPQHYLSMPRQRNGKCYIMGHDYMAKCALYGGMDVVNNVMTGLTQLGDKFDYCGYNNDIREHNRGSVHVRDLVHHSVAVYTSFVQTMGFALIESLCSGVPVIMTPKLDLPESLSGTHYVVARTADEFLTWTKRLMNDPELSLQMGQRAQTFMREHFAFANYRRKLRPWMTSITRGTPTWEQ
jgi:hypothetical protein